MAEALSYPAHAFYGDRRISGELSIEGSVVRFRGTDLDVAFPVSGAQIKLGGASDRLVFFSHPDHPEVSLYTSDRRILRDPSLSGHAPARDQVRQARRRRCFNWTLLAVVFAVVVGLPVLLVLNFRAASGVIARQVPAQWEHELGRSVFAQYRRSNLVLEQPALREQLAALSAPLLGALESERYQFDLYLVNDPNINAFALPGGVIVVNSGLVLAASDADELLGVLAHEISHVTEQHGIRNIITSAGVFVGVQALLGDVSGLLSVIASAAPLLINQAYSREFEAAADEHAFVLLLRADIDPAGLVGFFQRIRAEEQERLAELGDDARWLDDNLGLLNSHPATEERIAAVEARLAALEQRDFRDLNAQFQHLQRTLKAALADSDEERTTQ